MKVFFNGRETDAGTPPCTLAEFLAGREFERGMVLIRVNDTLVLYQDHASYPLSEGDRIDTEHVLLAGG